MKKISQLNPISIAILAVAIGIASYMANIQFLDMMELKTIDMRFLARDPIDPSSHVVLAVIDEKSLAREGKWIWPRSKIANLITKLSDAGARIIAMDIFFSEPDDKAIARTIEAIAQQSKKFEIGNEQFQAYLDQIKQSSDQDMLLATAIKDSKAKVVLGYFFQMDDTPAAVVEERILDQHEANIFGSKYQYTHYDSAMAMEVPFLTAQFPQSNIAAIADAAEYAGTINKISDDDGVVRRMPAVFSFRDNAYAPLSLMAVSAYMDSPPSLRVSDYGLEALKIDELNIPTDEMGRIIINYRGEEKTFPHISATDILHGSIPDGIFQDKIVLVGATATGVYDLRVTPFSNVYPGLEIHANVVDSILAEDFLYRPAWGAIFDILAMAAGALILGFVLPQTGVALGAIAAAGLFAGYIYICQLYFTTNGWVLNLVYPLSVILLVYVSITAYKYLTESKQKRFVRNAFSTYLAPAVVKQLMDSPEKLALGGDEREITAFFSDVQGFTSISEKLTPTELVDLLQEFLAEMTDIILNYEGTVDKFEGDAIIAMFGAPIDMANHAEVAAKASIDMQKRLVKLREDYMAAGKPELHMRIGLETGPAVVGNMGSRNRMDYTMMGNTVNTASRLEGVNKVYGIYSLIGETTYKAAGDSIAVREIDSVNVVGKEEPVKIYQLLGYPGDIEDRLQQTVDHYRLGLQAYRSRSFDQAAAAFSAALSIIPDDGPSKTMLGRCEELKLNPPESGWNGTYTMKTK